MIVDWVPAHFPKDEWALARFDGEPLYEYPDPRKGEHPDWGTLVFDFGRREVRNFLVANAVYWLGEFHVDALRVDAVASMLYLDYSREDGQWIPNRYGGREHLEAIDFLQEVNATAYKRVPGIMMIAEESTAWPGVTAPTDAGGLGFGLKWNMGWMHDSLRYLAEDPVNRSHHHDEVTFSLVYAFTEAFTLPISHDEVVHGKGSLLRKIPGDRWQQVATMRAFYAYMWSHPGKQLLFMGQEFGQEAEWAEGRSLDWWLLDQPLHAGLLACVSDLNAFYRATPALWELDSSGEGFAWIDATDRENDTFSYVRRARATAARWRWWSTSPGCPTRATAWACRRPGAGARRSTPTASPTAARGSATPASWRRTRRAPRAARLGHPARAPAGRAVPGARGRLRQRWPDVSIIAPPSARGQARRPQDRAIQP